MNRGGGGVVGEHKVCVGITIRMGAHGVRSRGLDLTYLCPDVCVIPIKRDVNK